MIFPANHSIILEVREEAFPVDGVDTAVGGRSRYGELSKCVMNQKKVAQRTIPITFSRFFLRC